MCHLPALKSDHRPILLQSRQQREFGRSNKQFRFMANWLADESFKGVVQEAWSQCGDWHQAVASFQEKASKWNYESFGNIFHRKRRIMARLEGIDRKRGMGRV